MNTKNIETLKEKQLSHGSAKEKIVKPLKKVILPEDNNEFKVINNYCVLLFIQYSFNLHIIYVCIFIISFIYLYISILDDIFLPLYLTAVSEYVCKHNI